MLLSWSTYVLSSVSIQILHKIWYENIPAIVRKGKPTESAKKISAKQVIII
ncbi:hypothetical protein JMUB7476_27540 [Staphylococcus aureus]